MRIRTGISADRNGGSRVGSNSKWTVRRDPAGKGQNNQPHRRGTGRRKDRDGKAGGKAGDDGLEFMRGMAGGLGTRLAISLLAGLMLSSGG